MRLGFACLWGRDRPSTWSGTPFKLLEALRGTQDEVVDLGPDLPDYARAMMRVSHMRRREDRWVSSWQHSPLLDLVAQQLLSRRIRTTSPDAILQIQDLAKYKRPYVTYLDLSFDAFAEARAVIDPRQLQWLTPQLIDRRRERQLDILSHACTTVTMSRWLADHLVNVSGVPANRVEVVYPGRNTPTFTTGAVRTRTNEQRRRLLFVGRAFRRKGGDQVLAAYKELREGGHSELSLTIAGPSRWPLTQSPPAGVKFVGDVSPNEVAELYKTHDLFVMPSRFEAFGIVFAEALSAGLPCIARDAYAMPEIVQDQVTGALVRGEEPSELAQLILDVLANDLIYDRVERDRVDFAKRFSWPVAAQSIFELIRERC